MARDPKNRPGRSLAARFKSAIEQRTEAQRKEEAEASRLQETIQRERDRLMGDLEAFGRAIGHFTLMRREDRLTLSLDSRHLVFDAPRDGGHISVTGDVPGTCTIEYEAQLRGWILVYDPPVGSQDKFVLFDQGLEFLIGKAFELSAAEPLEP